MSWQQQCDRWAHAFGGPVLQGRLKQDVEDFRVDEELGFQPDGEGEHEFLYVEKTGLTTLQVQHALSRHYQLPLKDISYAGLKDKQGITRQWFSLRTGLRKQLSADAEVAPAIRVLDRQRNKRKLQRGSHRGNHFQIALRECSETSDETWTTRLKQIGEQGVPNYFGPQRFGHDAGNLTQAESWFTTQTPPASRELRSIVLSAARSFLFNEVLSQRVQQGSWNRALPGDVMALSGSTRTFAAERATEAELQQRLGDFDIHPTGPLYGEGEIPCGADAKSLEIAVLQRHSLFRQGLEHAGLQQERRALRLQVQDLHYEMNTTLATNTLNLRFRLERGAYATAVLRELIQTEQ